MGKSTQCVCLCSADLELLQVAVRQYTERCCSDHRLKDTAVYVLRGSTSSLKGPAAFKKEVKSPLEPQKSRPVMVQDDESAGSALERDTVRNA